MVAVSGKERLHIVLHGTVQGMGFRPTIYRIAQKLHLAGWVRNADGGIEIEVEGRTEQLETFLRLLQSERPRAAVVATQQIVRMVPQQSAWFEIVPSEQREEFRTPPGVSPD